MQFSLALISILFIFGAALDEEDSAQTIIKVEHSIDGKIWQRRGEFAIPERILIGIPSQASNDGNFSSYKNNIRHSLTSSVTQSVEIFKTNPQKGRYYLRVSQSNGRFATTSVSLCDVVASNFQDEILFHLDSSFKRITGIEYKVPNRCSDDKIPSYSVSNFKTTMTIEAPSEGRRVKEENANVRAPDGTVQDKKDEKKEPEPSFFQKYWYIIVPVGVIVIINNLLSGLGEPQGQQGQQGQRRPAPRPQ